MIERMRRSDPQLAQAIERNDIGTQSSLSPLLLFSMVELSDAFAQSMINRTAPRGAARPAEMDLLDPRIQQRIEETIK